MDSIRAIIVDDEALARKRLRRLLKSHADIAIIDECGNGREAITSVNELKPSLIFLDVEMPGINGFEVLLQISPENMPLVVFVTAYSEHAIKAFEVSAIDYLLKPFEVERLTQTIERIRSQVTLRTTINAELCERLVRVVRAVQGTDRERGYVNRFLIKSSDRSMFVRVDQIDRIEAAGKYVRLYQGKKYDLLRLSIQEVETQLDPLQFARIHRSMIVKLDSIKEFQKLFHGDMLAILHDGSELTVSRRYKAKLETRVHGFF